MDLGLDPTTGDLDISGNTLHLVDGDDAIRQQLAIRYQFFKGEWQNDLRVGFPYFESVLVKNPDTNVIRGMYRQATVTTPGLDSIENLTLAINPATRVLSVSVRARKLNGAVLTFDREFLIT